MTDDDHTMDRLLSAFDEGPEVPADVDDAVASILGRLGIEGSRPVPAPRGEPRPAASPAPRWLPWVAVLALGEVIYFATTARFQSQGRMLKQKEFFRHIYRLTTGKDKGPRIPILLISIGIARTRHLLGGDAGG